MSDEKKTKDVGGMTPQVAGLKRLEMRSKRFARLVQSNAPPVVLANDVLLIWEAMMLAYPNEFGDAIADREHTQFKLKLGYCYMTGCDKAAVEGEDACPEHLAELLAFNEDDDELH
jgi:hypothetical protein